MQSATALNEAKARVLTIAVPWPALGVLMFGLVMLYSVGFSTSSTTSICSGPTSRPVAAIVGKSLPPPRSQVRESMRWFCDYALNTTPTNASRKRVARPFCDVLSRQTSPSH